MDKQAVREAVWDAFDEGDQARFPFPPHDRIPNFAGADAAAERLAETEAWDAAATLKATPDAPQLPVRRAALRAGKTVYVAQPRLRDPDPFLRLDPTEIPPDEIDDATTVSGISEYGTPTAPEDVARVDLIVAGSVGVTTDGARIGKGEGYSDLEWAVLRELDAVDDGTTVATTVHELSVLDGPTSTCRRPTPTTCRSTSWSRRSGRSRRRRRTRDRTGSTGTRSTRRSCPRYRSSRNGRRRGGNDSCGPRRED